MWDEVDGGAGRTTPSSQNNNNNNSNNAETTTDVWGDLERAHSISALRPNRNAATVEEPPAGSLEQEISTYLTSEDTDDGGDVWNMLDKNNNNQEEQ